MEGEGFQAADSRPYEETGAFRNIGRGRSQTGPRAHNVRPYVFPKTAGGSGTRSYKRQNRFGHAVEAGHCPARLGMGHG